MRIRPRPLQESRQNQTLGQIIALCKIDYDIGHYPIFRVSKPTKKSAVDVDPATTGEPRLSKFSIHTPKVHWEIKAHENLSYTDLNTFLGVVKAFQNLSGETYSAGKRAIENGQPTVDVTGIKLSKNVFCEYFGKSPGGKSNQEIRESLVRLQSAVITQEHPNIIRKFRLITDFTWDISALRFDRDNEAELIMDTAFLNACAGTERGFQVRWKALQGLKSQVAKGLLLYVDCNNPIRPKASQTEPMWQPILENRIFKFLYRLDKPIFNIPDYGDKPPSVETQYEDLQNTRQQYAIDMQNYRNTCRELRSEVNKAFNVLKSQGLIEDFRRVPAVKDGKKTERKLWMVIKNNYRVKTAGQGELSTIINGGISKEDCGDIPF